MAHFKGNMGHDATSDAHLGQYAFTSGNRIFEKKKDWKGENDRHSKSKKADHRDNAPKPETFKDPVVYFTVAIATDIPP